MIEWSDVTAIASELSTVPEAAQDLILAFVEAEVSEARWGEAPAMAARIYLAAHLATVGTKRAGAAGPVTSESVGQVSRTYASSIAEGAAMLGSTSYGLEYERRIRQRPAFRFVVA